MIAEFDFNPTWATTPANATMLLLDLPLVCDAFADGVLGHFRLVGSDGVCHVQGTLGVLGIGGMQVDETDVIASQPITIGGFQIGM